MEIEFTDGAAHIGRNNVNALNPGESVHVGDGRS